MRPAGVQTTAESMTLGVARRMGAMVDIADDLKADQVRQKLQAFQRVEVVIQKDIQILGHLAVERAFWVGDPAESALDHLVLVGQKLIPGAVDDPRKLAQSLVALLQQCTKLASHSRASFGIALGAG